MKMYRLSFQRGTRIQELCIIKLVGWFVGRCVYVGGWVGGWAYRSGWSVGGCIVDRSVAFGRVGSGRSHYFGLIGSVGP